MFAAGMVFGPFSGGILYEHFGFATPFLVAAGLQFVTLLLTITMLPESHTRRKDEERMGLNAIVGSFLKPRLARLLWQKLAIALSLYGWFAAFALFLQRQLSFNLTETDYLFSIFAVVNVVMNAYVVGRVSARLGDRSMSNVGLACLVAGFALVPFVGHSLALVATSLLLFGFGMALANTGITALISNAASDREQGTVLGTSSSLDSLSGILAPPVSTGMLGALGPRFAGIESLTFASIALSMGVINARREAVHASEDRVRARGGDGAVTIAADIETVDGSLR
jgi:DHA1 family tetracycline resistance protein-like MFS transporter